MDSLKDTFQPHLDQLGQAAAAASIARAIYCFTKIIPVMQTKDVGKIRIHTYIDNILIAAIMLKHSLLFDDNYEWQASIVVLPLYLIFFALWAINAHCKLKPALDRFCVEAVVLGALLGYAYYEKDSEGIKGNYDIAGCVIICLVALIKAPELNNMYKNKSVCLSNTGSLDFINSLIAVIANLLWISYAIAVGDDLFYLMIQEMVRAIFHMAQLGLVFVFDKPF